MTDWAPMGQPQGFEYSLEARESKLIVTLEGGLDVYTTAELEAALRPKLSRKIHDVVLDCEKVDFVDSAFLRLLLELKYENLNVKVTNASRTVRRIFEITALDGQFLA